MPQYQCCVCEGFFQFGPVYDGRPVRDWQKLMLCRSCEAANHDGIIPQTHPHLIPRLESLGIKVILNQEGWIVIPA
jgi:hypothetical protein